MILSRMLQGPQPLSLLSGPVCSLASMVPDSILVLLSVPIHLIEVVFNGFFFKKNPLFVLIWGFALFHKNYMIFSEKGPVSSLVLVFA